MSEVLEIEPGLYRVDGESDEPFSLATLGADEHVCYRTTSPKFFLVQPTLEKAEAAGREALEVYRTTALR